MDNLNFACKIGFIIDIQDPQNRGWVQVRVPMVHNGLADDLLPWARVINMGGGSYDSGGQLPFEKGSSVAVIFEDGNVFKPMILGGLPKKVAEYQEYESTNEDEGSWKPTDGNRPVDMETDSPYESKESAGNFNVFKSPKGHTIVISETPEGEFLKIIDRSGQIIEMNSPVKLTENVGNKAQRGNQNAVDETALSYLKMSGASWIRILDLSGNEIYLYSKENDEQVLIKNSSNDNSFTMNKDGFFFQILGGQSSGGMDLTITKDGLKLNGKFLMSESFANWMDASKTTLTTTTSPGSPSPIFPSALANFSGKLPISINSDGFKTKL